MKQSVTRMPPWGIRQAWVPGSPDFALWLGHPWARPQPTSRGPRQQRVEADLPPTGKVAGSSSVRAWPWESSLREGARFPARLLGPPEGELPGRVPRDRDQACTAA